MNKIKYITIFNIFSAFLGFAGTIFMVKGVITSSPQEIANLGESYLGMNPFFLKNFAESRADTICGIFMVSISFFLQMAIHLFETKLQNTIDIFSKKIIAYISIFLIISIIFIGFVHSSLNKNTIFSTYKQIAINGLTKQYNYNKNHQVNNNSKVTLSEGQVKKLYGYMGNLSFKKKWK